jgi:hypothetical protein
MASRYSRIGEPANLAPPTSILLVPGLVVVWLAFNDSNVEPFGRRRHDEVTDPHFVNKSPQATCGIPQGLIVVGVAIRIWFGIGFSERRFESFPVASLAKVPCLGPSNGNISLP